jgi:MraZ protein
MIFQGSSSLSLDAKGRMVCPAKHRDALLIESEGRLTLTKHPHGCLLLFPRNTWLKHREIIASWPMAAKQWQRIFLGSAEDVDIDSAGRILLPPELREAAGLEKEISLLGMGSHCEIWNRARLHEQEQQALEAGLPDVLNQFSF